jgi:hypothetical protein
VRRAGPLCALVIVCLVAACGSPTPSAAPSPSPVQAAPDPRLVEFESHVAAAVRVQLRLVDGLAKASAGPPAGLRGPARQMTDWATGEIAWLDDHPADPCYRDAADAYRGGVEAILTSATAFGRLATASAPPTVAEGQAAGQGLSDGQSAMQLGALKANASRAGCRS